MQENDKTDFERDLQVIRDNAATVEQNLRHEIELEHAAWKKRNEDANKLEHKINGPSGLREQLEAARKAEQIELRLRQKAEARAAKLQRETNWLYKLFFEHVGTDAAYVDPEGFEALNENR